MKKSWFLVGLNLETYRNKEITIKPFKHLFKSFLLANSSQFLPSQQAQSSHNYFPSLFFYSFPLQKSNINKLMMFQKGQNHWHFHILNQVRVHTLLMPQILIAQWLDYKQFQRMDNSSFQSSEDSEEQMMEAIFDPWDNLSNASSNYPESGEVLERVMGWFQAKGVAMGAPQEIAQEMVEQHRKSIIKRTGHHLELGPWLSRRVKSISLLHIDNISKII